VTPFPVQLASTEEPLLVTLETDLTRARLGNARNDATAIRLVEVVNDRVA
jgi:hypothetical protein